MVSSDFPKLLKFLQDNRVPPEHPVWCREHRLLEALEYFFSLPDGLPGLADQKKKFLRLRPGDGRTNDLEVEQASFWAEVRATYLLGEILSAQILSFEQPSSRSSGGTCDLIAMFEGNRRCFEVKRRSADVRQRIPTLLEEELLTCESLLQERRDSSVPQLYGN